MFWRDESLYIRHGLALGDGLAHWATLPGWFLMRRGPGVSFLNPWLFMGDPAGIHEGAGDALMNETALCPDE